MELQWLVVFAIVCIKGAATINCHQGFNATVLGVPFYQWDQTECDDDSACFSQEIAARFPRPEIEVEARYGGCVSKSYSQLLSCKSLFGHDSDLDPGALFNTLPGLDQIIESIEREFSRNTTEAYRMLFSNGTGTDSFIDGCLRLMSNIGIDTEKAIPLKADLVNLINLTLPRHKFRIEGVTLTTGVGQAEIDDAFNKFMSKLREVIDAYKTDYPDSEFPELVWRIAQYYNASYNLPTSRGCYFGHHGWNFDIEEINGCVTSRKEAAAKLKDVAIDILVDVQFAVFNEWDFVRELNLFQEILKAFPEYQFYIRLFRLLDREDIKEIYKIFPKYLTSFEDNHGKGIFKMLVRAFNVTIAKITSKFGEFTSELRRHFAPNTCKYHNCPSSLCNTHEKLTSEKEMVITEFDEETPSSGRETEAQKSPRIEPDVASSLSASTGNNPEAHLPEATENSTQKTQETTSSSAAVGVTNYGIMITFLVSRAVV